MSLGPSKHVPNIRLRAMAKRVDLRQLDSNTSRSEHSQSLSSTNSEFSFPSTESDIGMEELTRSSISFQPMISSHRHSTSSEHIQFTDLRSIMKSKLWKKALKECRKENPSPLLPEEDDLRKLLQDLLVEEPLHEETICEVINTQRFQTDEDILRQNLAIAEAVVNYVVSKAEETVNKGKIKPPTTMNMAQLARSKTNVEWPTKREFNLTVGGQRIRDYIQTWELNKKWGFSIDLLDIRQDASSRYYVYEVQWCIPTLQHPIPSCSVSVYFIYQISKYLPPNYHVTVTYIIEGSTRQHSVHDVPVFHEKWLTHVLEAKYELMKQIQF
ncbi:hypothetical protein M8J77_015604 [Diaphorina citri]|nr:hypothetical protein M8J77_015604 [Diaphorina citri]